MSGGQAFFAESSAPAQVATGSPFQRVLHRFRGAVYTLSTVALLAAAAIMTIGVAARQFFGVALIWQDETCVFLLVGATFLSAASVQAHRGHVGIEAIVGMLSPGVNRARIIVSDLLSFLFCAFFTWKAAELFHEAWEEGQTSASPWGPPMWIPYALMSVGMLFLTLQLLLQVVAGITGRDVK